jgi:hypothetical protein
MTNFKKDVAFNVRAYSISELAVCYNPHLTSRGAWSHLKRWIGFNPALQEELKTLGYVPGIRSFTPKQVGCIVKYLGEPW